MIVLLAVGCFIAFVIYAWRQASDAHKDFLRVCGIAEDFMSMADKASRQRDAFDHERRCLQRRLAKMRRSRL